MIRWLALAFGFVVLATLSWCLFSGPSCTLAYIKLHGDLVTYIPVNENSTSTALDQVASDDVVASIRRADGDPSIKALLLEVDSLGGSPVAGEEIQAALQAAHKPTVALIRDSGDSAAYLAASGAGTIFASAASDVGDIGVTQSYTDTAIQDAQSGITFNQLSIGKYKDMFNPDKPLTPDERALALQELQNVYDHIVALIARDRHMATSTVYALANGASYTGQEALANGLIDELGNDADAEAYLAKEARMERVDVCLY